MRSLVKLAAALAVACCLALAQSQARAQLAFVNPAPPDRTIAELTTLTITNAAQDLSNPSAVLGYTLFLPPAGASIDPTTGVIRWTPSEAQGPSTTNLTTIVFESGPGGFVTISNSF